MTTASGIAFSAGPAADMKRALKDYYQIIGVTRKEAVNI